MPYIEPPDRQRLDNVLDSLSDPINRIYSDYYKNDVIFRNKGELEYCLFKLMKLYMSDRIASYCSLHSCVYAVIHAGEEFRRRFLDKREDEARQENGDIS